ncbi:MAG: hypothetical protein JRN67_03785 [Nitrososphaerota archaeon]|nr:hypothetical protein [Nitrososphaerota archaeon]
MLSLANSSFHEKQEWLAHVTKEREAYQRVFTEIGSSDARPIKAARLVTEIRDFVDGETYVITDGSDVAALGRVYLQARLPRHIINGPSNWGNMGTGVALAIGVKLARPDSRVLLMTSDGSFGFNAFEMETASRYGIPIVVVIGNNHSWASDHNILLKVMGEKYAKSLVSWLPEETRYDKFAESVGCYGQLVTEPSDIRPALQRAFDSKRPSVLDVRLERSDAWPSRTEKYSPLDMPLEKGLVI